MMRSVLVAGGLALLGTAAGIGPVAAAADGPSGGYSFNEAASIGSGEPAEQALVLGEWRYWKLSAKAGQSVKVHVELTVPDGYDPAAGETVIAHVYDPVRENIDTKCGKDELHTSINDPGTTLELDCEVGQGNGIDSKPLEISGSYYLVVGFSGGVFDNNLGRSLPVQVTMSKAEGLAPSPKPFDPGKPPRGVSIPEAGAGTRSGAAASKSGDGADSADGPSDDGTRTEAAASSSSAGDFALSGGVLVGGVLLGYLVLLGAQRRRGAVVAAAPASAADSSGQWGPPPDNPYVTGPQAPPPPSQAPPGVPQGEAFGTPQGEAFGRPPQ
jgi:hypothetical protein